MHTPIMQQRAKKSRMSRWHLFMFVSFQNLARHELADYYTLIKLGGQHFPRVSWNSCTLRNQCKSHTEDPSNSTWSTGRSLAGIFQHLISNVHFYFLVGNFSYFVYHVLYHRYCKQVTLKYFSVIFSCFKEQGVYYIEGVKLLELPIFSKVCSLVQWILSNCKNSFVTPCCLTYWNIICSIQNKLSFVYASLNIYWSKFNTMIIIWQYFLYT